MFYLALSAKLPIPYTAVLQVLAVSSTKGLFMGSPPTAILLQNTWAVPDHLPSQSQVKSLKEMGN